jgi:hypothetical protein
MRRIIKQMKMDEIDASCGLSGEGEKCKQISAEEAEVKIPPRLR